MKKFQVHYDKHGPNALRSHEIFAATLLAEYFKSDIEVHRRAASKTPDLIIRKTNVRWELKSPTGGGKHTIQNNLRAAKDQSENIILDFSRIKLSDYQGISRTKEFLRNENSYIKRLKIITKNKIVLTIREK